MNGPWWFCKVLDAAVSILDSSGKFWPDLWIDFSSFALIEMLHDGYDQF